MELWDIYDSSKNKTGEIHIAGQPLRPGQYHLAVHAWIKNSQGLYLISKRDPVGTYPGLWECTCGSAQAGETGLEAAVREAQEELGVSLDPLGGTKLHSYFIKTRPVICEAYLFNKDVDIDDIVLLEGETCDAKWADSEEILKLIKAGQYVPHYDYISTVFDWAR